jgi:hypothetical protein
MSLVGLAVLILEIYVLVRIVQSSMSTANKVIWALIVLFFPLIGGIVYLIVGGRPIVKA